MRIDAHQHFWQLARGDYDWLTPELGTIYRDFDYADFAPLMDSHQVLGSVLVQAAPSYAETQYLLQLAAQHNRIFAVVGWVDFASTDVRQQIEALAQRPKLRGLRPMIQDIEDVDWMLNDDLSDAFDAMIEHNLCFDALVLPKHLANLLLLVDRYPTLKVVIDHAAKPQIADQSFEPWATQIAKLASYKNVYCKLSGLVTEAKQTWKTSDLHDYSEHLLNTFTTERLIWGSDWPVLNLAADYTRWISTSEELLDGLTDAQKQQVFSTNAIKFYDLKLPAELLD
jgi:L-fuconolactonase